MCSLSLSLSVSQNKVTNKKETPGLESYSATYTLSDLRQSTNFSEGQLHAEITGFPGAKIRPQEHAPPRTSCPRPRKRRRGSPRSSAWRRAPTPTSGREVPRTLQKITTMFSHVQTVVLSGGRSTVLCQPTEGQARLREGCSFRWKQH